MKRLILTDKGAGADNLKKAGVGDMTIGVSMLGADVGLGRRLDHANQEQMVATTATAERKFLASRS